MKKIMLVMVFALLVLSTSVFAASVSRNMPSRVSPGDDIQMTFSISGVTIGEVFTLEDQAPQGWKVDAWSVSGAQGGIEGVDYRFVAANRHGFSFTAESANPTISFTVKVPATAANGDYSFDAVYFDSSGQARTPGTVTVRTITCGDGVCEGGENSDTCLADCPAPAPPPAPAETAPTEEPVDEGEKGVPGATSTIVLAVVVALLVGAFFLYTKRKK